LPVTQVTSTRAAGWRLSTGRRTRAVARNAFEDSSAASAVVAKIWVRNRTKCGYVLASRRDDDQTVTVSDRQPPEQHSIDDTEYRGVDAERECEDRRRGEGRRTTKKPRSEHEVPHAQPSTPLLAELA